MEILGDGSLSPHQGQGRNGGCAKKAIKPIKRPHATNRVKRWLLLL